MKYYPAFLQLAGQPCVVIGGGTVAEQKVRSLLSAGAKVTVVSPSLTPSLAQDAAAGHITHVARTYEQGDLQGYRIAIAATSDAAAHQEIAAEAAATGVLLNVVDQPLLCDFIVPALIERGDLLIAASTSGKSPALARRIRQQLEGQFGPEYAQALVILGRLREFLRERALPEPERRRILGALVDSELLHRLQQGQTQEVDRLLAQAAGTSVSLAALGVDLTQPPPCTV